MLAITSVTGQVEEKKRLIQATGFITDADNRPVHHASVISKKLSRGTSSEMTGIYSIVSMPGDTIFISALGYKRYMFSIPGNFNEKIFKMDVKLISDTISIEGITVLPWRSYDEFKREFLSTLPRSRPEVLYMYENLAYIQRSIENMEMTTTPEAGFRMAMQQQTNATMTRNQAPYNNLLNPFAWAKFFSGVKEGLLKNEKSQQKARKKQKN